MIDQESRKDEPMTFDEMLEDMEFMLEASRFNDSVQWNPDMRTAALEKAIELLKTLEPRVMAPRDFDENPMRDKYGYLPCWLESREHLIESNWNHWNEDDFFRPALRNFRPWTSRPTDEQVAATPWEEQHHA